MSEKLTCGECPFFDGEECDGYREGAEVYDGSEACEEYKQELEEE